MKLEFADGQTHLGIPIKFADEPGASGRSRRGSASTRAARWPPPVSTAPRSSAAAAALGAIR